MAFENVEAKKVHLPGGESAGDADASAKPVADKKKNPLDSEDNRKLGKRLWDWYEQERIKQSANRIEMAIDEDFHDNLQWSEEDAETLKERGQAPLVFNKGREKIEWLTGTERRTRVDHKVFPRKGGEEALKDSDNKTKLMKYVSDVSKAGFARSRAFEDAVKVGIGWIEEGVRHDPSNEPIYSRHESWRNIIWDSCGVELDTMDWRYLVREKTTDLDIGEAMFPDRKATLKEASITSDILGQDQDEFYYLGQRVGNTDTELRTAGHRVYVGDTFSAHNRRVRVKLYEVWYRVPVKAQVMRGAVFNGRAFDAKNDLHQRAVADGLVSLFDAIVMEVRCAVMVKGGKLLQDMKSPYKHGRFPFIPVWCFRRGRDGMPYGIWRIMRDPQEDLNKRMSKALFMLSSRQVIADEGAVEDWDELRDEAARPDGIIIKNKGKELTMRDQPELADQHLRLVEMDVQFMESGSAVTSELLGQDTNATSGKAVLAKQTQGAVTTAPMFDNMRLAVQLSGEIRLSNIEQFMSEPRMIRILGPRGKADFLEINQPMQGEDGETQFFNDITAFEADFVVSEQDYSETIRMALFDQLMQMLGKMPEQFAAQLLDSVLELAPVPGIEELVRRIRKLTGQTDPDAEPTPEDLQAAQAKQAADAEAAAIQKRGVMAEIDVKEAQAEKFRAEAQAAVAKAGDGGMGDEQRAQFEQQVQDMQARYDETVAEFSAEVDKIRLAASSKEKEIEARYQAQIDTAKLESATKERIARYEADRAKEAAAAKTKAEHAVGMASTKHEDRVKQLQTQLAEVTKSLKQVSKVAEKAAKTKVKAKA